MEDLSKDEGFCIKVYSPGNFIAKSIVIEGDVNIGTGNIKQKFSDEQIAQAITAINGEDLPLNSKRLWAAVYWYLRWACGFPVKTQDFCDRVKLLPLGELEYPCEYNSIRHFTTLTFMNQDATQLDKVKPSKNDDAFFQQCRVVVFALQKELGKAYLPRHKK